MTNSEVEQWLGRYYLGGHIAPHHTARGSTQSEASVLDLHDSELHLSFLVTAEDGYLPNVQDLDWAPVFVRHRNQLYRTTVGEVHDECHQLQKYMDCQKCPLYATQRCLTRHFPKGTAPLWEGEEVQLSLIRGRPADFARPPAELKRIFDYDDWKKKCPTPWEGTLAGYTYVPSVATSPDTPQPGVKGIRSPYDQFFGEDLEDVRKQLSDRTQAGVETRKTIHYECSKCYFGTTYKYSSMKRAKAVPCHKHHPRWCEHKAWTEESVHAYTMAYFDECLKDSAWTRERVWKVAWICGTYFKRTNEHTRRPREWTVSYMRSYYNPSNPKQIRVSVQRTARDVRSGGSCKDFETEAALRDFLPDAMCEMMDAAPPIDEKLFGLWIQLSSANMGKSYGLYAGYGQYQPAVGHVSLNHSWRNHVQVELWLSRHERTHTFSSYKEIMAHYEELLLFSITKKEALTFNTSWQAA